MVLSLEHNWTKKPLVWAIPLQNKECQGHSHWYKSIYYNIKLSSIYYHTKYGGNWFINFRLYLISSFFLFFSNKKYMMIPPMIINLTRLNEHQLNQTGKFHKRIKFYQNRLRILWHNWCKLFWLSATPVALIKDEANSAWYKSEKFSDDNNHGRFETSWFKYVWTCANLNIFWTQSVKQQSFPSINFT